MSIEKSFAFFQKVKDPDKYLILEEEDILNIIRNKDWLINPTKKVTKKNLTIFLATLKIILKYNYKDKLGEYIRNSRLYKIIEAYCKHNYNKSLNNNTIDDDEIILLQRYQLLTSNRIRKEDNINKLNPRLKYIYENIYPHLNETSYFNILPGDEHLINSFSVYKGRIRIEKLNSIQKLQLLHLVRGDKPNVLL